LAFLQAVVDDSASDRGDKRLFLAGFLLSAGDWAKFSDAWDAALKHGKPIAYLKMSEANSLRGEFSGWTDEARDLKLASLKLVIDEFDPLSFHVSVARAGKWEHFKAVAPRGLGAPHFPCTFAVASMLGKYAASESIPNKIEFIFDQQNGVDDDISLFFNYMKKGLPRETRERIAYKPIFRDDKLFAPLQAADMLAWGLRRTHEECGDWKANTRPMPIGNRHVSNEVDSLLYAWIDAFSKMPAIKRMQSKADWRNLKVALRDSLARGYIPPHGTRVKNLYHAVRSRISQAFRR